MQNFLAKERSEPKQKKELRMKYTTKLLLALPISLLAMALVANAASITPDLGNSSMIVIPEPVPEPGSLALLGIGLAISYRLRKKFNRIP